MPPMPGGMGAPPPGAPGAAGKPAAKVKASNVWSSLEKMFKDQQPDEGKPGKGSPEEKKPDVKLS